MKRLAAILLAFCAAGAGAQSYTPFPPGGVYAYSPQWQPSTEIWTPADNTARPTAVFTNSYTQSGCAPATWCTVDLTAAGVAVDAKAAFLSGIQVITHGAAAQTCDMRIAFRAPGSSLTPDYYIAQVVETAIGGGQRSTMATWVPLVNGKFEWQWNRSTTGQWPAECSYGLSLSAQAWVR